MQNDLDGAVLETALTVAALPPSVMHVFLCLSYTCSFLSFFFFFNDTATTEIYTLSLHDALPILRADDVRELRVAHRGELVVGLARRPHLVHRAGLPRDRKSTRLNSSHSQISYAVFCLKKKKIIK